MVKKNTRKKVAHVDSKRSQKIVLGAVAVAALGALAIMVLVVPSNGDANTGATGFSAFEKKGADIGIAKVTSEQTVKNALGKKVKSVSAVDVSGVLSINGNLGQTATYNFVLPDGSTGWIDVDVKQYKDRKSYDEDNVFAGTGAAGTINDRDIRYLPATSLGKERIYSLLVTNNLKSYKFALSQPNDKVQILEYKAQDILKEIIKNSNL